MCIIVFGFIMHLHLHSVYCQCKINNSQVNHYNVEILSDFPETCHNCLVSPHRVVSYQHPMFVLKTGVKMAALNKCISFKC